MTRLRGRTDNNQTEIVAALRQAGAFVQSLANIGHGCPDLLVAYHGIWSVLEVKNTNGRLTDDEFNWHAKAGEKAYVSIVRSADEALEVICKVRRRKQ